MEFAKTELIAIEDAVNEAANTDIQALTDLQLTLVGGGVGDVVIL